MSEGATSGLHPVRRRWWRQSWLWMALAILAAEVGVVVLLSSRGALVGPAPRSPMPRYRMVPEAEEGGDRDRAELWSALMSPAVMLMPSAYDFSGSSWLAGPKAEVALESFLAPIQPLPFESIRGGGGLEPYARVDPGPGSRWEVRGGMGPLPTVGPVPLPVDGWIRILEGLAGWTLDQSVRLEPLPEGVLAQRAVVRVTVDGSGTLASPPVIWESSGASVADEAALALVGKLQLTRAGSRAPAADGLERSWGFIAVSWPAPKEGPKEGGGKSS